MVSGDEKPPAGEGNAFSKKKSMHKIKKNHEPDKRLFP